jgi:hypothetical protein
MKGMLWAANECGNAQFGDIRLTKRLITLTTALSKHPEESLPVACGSWSETKAAYRFFSNDRVSSDEIYASHRQATLERIKEHSIILAVQDTTTFNFTLHRKTKGLGPIGQAGLSGFFLHSSMAVSVSGVPLGILAHQFWTRDQEPLHSRATHKKRAIEEKESLRWLTLLQKSTEDVPSSTRVIMVGDRESDIFDLFVLAEQTKRDFLIRAAWNRRLKHPEDYLFDAVVHSPILGTTVIEIPRADERPKRTATLVLRATSVSLRPPKHRLKEKLPSPTLNVIHVREEIPSEVEKPLEWFLLTTLPVSTLEEAVRYLTWYTYRWRIERYHFLLKSGCRVEELQLETKERLERAIAVYSIVAWRLLWLTYQARQSPASPCTLALSENEWKALYVAIHKESTFPSHPPTLQTAVRWIAKLGGFLGRKSDGEPGAKVLWRGFQRLQDLTLMWSALQ